ncbi:MAG: hypothetical protein O7C75_20500 [Verrucomicrobia bacterium]|nr:hypothetical protein [Verrucomicrobiota bacterium]
MTLKVSISRFLFSTRTRMVLTIVTVLLGLYALTGFVVVPWLARPRIVQTVAELTGRETRLDHLKLNPFTLSGTMVGFEITDTDGEKLLSFDLAHANVQALSFLFKGEYHFKELELTHPFVRLQVNKDDSINIADLINQLTDLPDPDPSEVS